MTKPRRILRNRAVAAVAVLVLLLVGAGIAQRGAMGGAGGYGAGGYGAGGMMGGQGAAPSRDWAEARALVARSGEGATLERGTNTVVFTGPRITIDMIAVQPDKPDTTFEVAGLVNPTIRVPRGAVIDLQLVNMDYGRDMAHGVVITRVPPPYATMSVPMMGTVGVAPLAPRTSEDLGSARYAVAGATFRATTPGTYYYLCQVPGHARDGMYGTLVVQ